jgi:hypothetical protein
LRPFSSIPSQFPFSILIHRIPGEFFRGRTYDVHPGGFFKPVNFLVAYVVVVIFIATLIRSTLGFGEALVAVPLLALRLPVHVAAPLAVLVSITVAAIVMLQEWRSVPLHAAGWLALWTMLGIPIGVTLLVAANQHIVKCALGSIIIAFALWSLLNRIPFELKRDRFGWLFLFGLSAGVLGGAYGMNGPPLVVYGSLRRWSAGQFRATLHGYFLPASAAGMIGFWAAGLWSHEVTRYYLVSLPATVIAALLGKSIHTCIPAAVFFKYVYAGLLAIGVLLLVQAG